MRTLAIALAALLNIGALAHSQTVLTRYEFKDASASPTSSAPNVDAKNVTLGRDSSYAVGFSGAGNIYFAGAPNGINFPNAGWATSSATAVSNQYYASFQIGATTGNALNLSSLSLNYGGATYSNDGTGISPFTVHVELRSSIDNFGSSLGEATPFIVTPNSPSTNTKGSYSFDLSSIAALQSMTDSITFRMYVWADNFVGNPTYVNSIRLDNLELIGGVEVIPEPGSISLLFGGVISAGILLYRKRRR